MPSNSSGTIVGATWTTDDTVRPMNIELGFGAGTVPGLVDGTQAADGNPITNKPGYTHNGAESLIRQTDAQMLGLAGDGSDTFWSADGLSIDDKSYADLLAHASGADNLWNKWFSIGGVCHLYEPFQYEFDKVFTQAEHDKNANYVGNGGGCGSIAPFP